MWPHPAACNAVWHGAPGVHHRGARRHCQGWGDRLSPGQNGSRQAAGQGRTGGRARHDQVCFEPVHRPVFDIDFHLVDESMVGL